MTDRFFNISSAVLLLVFFIIQTFCIYFNPVGLDEFHNLYLARKTLESKPYLNWTPFKTTFGLYFDTLPFYFYKDQWEILHAAKIIRILLTCIVLFWTIQNLKSFFSKNTIILSMFLLFCNNYFLSGSLELRPDLLNSLTGLISFVFLLKEQIFLSGLFVAISFCLSQKGLAYFIAANVGLLFCLITKKEGFNKILKFNAVFIVGLLAYVLYFSASTSFVEVLLNIFTTHLYLLTERNYPNVRDHWLFLIIDNPAFFILSFSAFFLIFKNKLNSYQSFVFIYSATLLFSCLIYPEPLPYFFIIFLPALFVLNIVTLEVMNRKVYFGLIILGGLYPLYLYCTSWKGEQGYQQIMTMLGEKLLEGDQRYLAGTSFLTFKDQTPEELTWIDMRMIRKLNESSEKHQVYLDKIKQNPPKFLYSNYKIDSLPKVFIDYFETRYFHYFGNIFVYSAEYKANSDHVNIDYQGKYILSSDRAIEFSGALLRPGSELVLEKTKYAAKSESDFKLIYKPKIQLDSRYDRYRKERQ